MGLIIMIHRAVVVPKPPVLFPTGGVNALAEERHECTKLAVRARTDEQRTRIIRWADRLTARIDREDKA